MPKFTQINADNTYYDDYRDTLDFLVKFLGIEEHHIEHFTVLFDQAWKTDGQFTWNGHRVNVIQY